MMSSTWLFSFSISLILWTASAQAGNYLYSFGGSGDAPTSENIFFNDFVDLNKFEKSAGWHASTLFDGDQPNDQTALAKATQNSNLKDFTNKNYQQVLNDISNKKFRSSDKVLFVINSHGDDKGTENGHFVECTGDTNCDSGDVKTVIDKLQSQGVQVALIDLSCFSGQSLKMANAKTCVIAASAEHDMSLSGFSKALLQNMKKGKSLEQVFLDSNTAEAAGAPRISSPAGVAAQKMILALAPEDQFFFNDDDLIDNANQAPSCTCDSRSENEIKKDMDLSKKFLLASVKSLPSAQNYMDASADYEELHSRILWLAKKIQPFSTQHLHFSNNGHSFSVDLVGITEAKENDAYGPWVYAKKLELEKTSPEFRELENNMQELQRLTALTADKSNEHGVGGTPLSDAVLRTQKYESQLYKELYQSYQGSEENPCAKFIL